MPGLFFFVVAVLVHCCLLQREGILAEMTYVFYKRKVILVAHICFCSMPGWVREEHDVEFDMVLDLKVTHLPLLQLIILHSKMDIRK